MNKLSKHKIFKDEPYMVGYLLGLDQFSHEASNAILLSNRRCEKGGWDTLKVCLDLVKLKKKKKIWKITFFLYLV